MELKFRCSGCGSKLAADSHLVGVEVECPRCLTKVCVPKPSLPQGLELGGFRVDHLLGTGAMGEVFLAKQLSMDRPVALKVLAADQVEDEESVEFFRNEVRTLARLDHPNIVGAFEAGEQDGKYYLAMTFVDGESLAERVDRDGPMDEKDALRIGLKVARALEYAWDKFRMLHRDVKPANIMLDSYGDVKLMDLGLAKNFAAESTPGQERFAYGTPDYMSPEQIHAVNTADFRTDIYALGATLYHLVTGTPPFVAPTANEVVSMHLTEPPPLAHEANPDVSESTSKLIRRMLAKQPEARQPSWDAVISEIRRTLKNLDSEKAEAAQKKKKNTLTNMPDQPAYSRPVVVETKSRSGLVTAAVALVAVALLAVVGWYVVQPLLAPQDGETTEPPIPLVEYPIDDPDPGGGTDPVDPPLEETPNVSDEELAARFDREMGELLATARLYEAEHVGDYQGIINRYQAVVDRGSGTPQGIAAYEEVSRLTAARDSAIEGVMTDLQQRTQRMVDEENYYAAAKVYREFEGPLADLTKDARADVARRYSILGRKVAAEATRVRSEASDKLDETLDALVNMLWQQQFPLLEKRVDQARKDRALEPVADISKPAFDAVAEAADYPRRIVRNLLDVGKTGEPVTVRLQKESIVVTIQGVDGSRVRCKKKVKIGDSEGWIGTTFDIRELHHTEMISRQGAANTTGTKLARLVLLVAANADAEAEGLLDEFEGPLGEALRRRWDEAHGNGAAVQGTDVGGGGTVAPTPTPTPLADDVPRNSLILWLAGDRGLEVVGSERRVVAWEDQSGQRHNAVQAVTSRQPTAYVIPGGGSAGVLIRNSSNTSTYLALDSRLVNRKEEVTFIIAFTTADQRSFTFNDRVFGMESNDGDFFRLDFWGAGIAGRPTMTLGLGNRKTTTATGPRVQKPGRSTVLVSLLAKDGYVVLRQNGEAGPPNRSRWEDGRIHAAGQMLVGTSALGANTAGSFAGAIHEVLLYDRVISEQEVQAIENQLAKKYGITLEN